MPGGQALLAQVPAVHSGEGYVLPSQGREVPEVLVRYVDSLAAQLANGRIYIGRVPQRDGGADEVEAAGPVHLVLVGAVAHLAQAVEEDRSREGVIPDPVVYFLA